jgi:phosphate acyltransferase
MVEIAPVAVDAMGGDNAPDVIVQGAINAARKRIPVRLVGAEAAVRAQRARRSAADRELAWCPGRSQQAPGV